MLHDVSALVPGGWTSYDCAPTGFSGTPTQRVSKYTRFGDVCVLWIDVTGTSNATTSTITLPFAPQLATSDGLIVSVPYVINNGSQDSSPGFGQCTSGTTLNIYRTGLAAWTGSGTKLFAFTWVYAVA